jgi:lipopolysaccharide export system permease protein
MRRLDGYLARELSVPFLINLIPVVALLLLLKLSGAIGEITQRHLPPMEVVKLVLYDLPSTLAQAFPLIAALSASLAMNRMTRDNEITVLRGAGVPVWRVLLPLVVFGVLVSVAALFLVDRVVPQAWEARQKSPVFSSGQVSGGTQGGKTLRVGDKVVSFQSSRELGAEVRRLERIVITEPLPSDQRRIVLAEWAEYSAGTWTLHNGTQLLYGKDRHLVTRGAFTTLPLRMPLDFRTVYNFLGEDDLMRQPFAVLTRQAAEAGRLQQWGQARDFEISRWFNVALPIMALPLTVLGAALAIKFSKAGAFTGVLFSVGITFVGWNTFLLMKGIANGGIVPPVVAAWATHILFLAGGAWATRSLE